MVTKKGLKKFKELYKQEFGVELSQAELLEKANRLLGLYRTVYAPNSNIKISTNHAKKVSPKKTSQ